MLHPTRQDLPDVMVKETMDAEIAIRDVYAGKKGVLFGVPGAFTPGCSEVGRCVWLLSHGA